MKQFHLGDILSITTDRLVSNRHMDGIYDILSYMTDDNLFTHQLPRASDECKPALLEQHPQLADVGVSELDKIPDWQTRSGRAAMVGEWLAPLVVQFGEYLDVEMLLPGEHMKINPVAEAEALAGPHKVIAIETDSWEAYGDG